MGEEEDYESMDVTEEYTSIETRRRKNSKKRKSRNGKDEKYVCTEHMWLYQKAIA